MTRNVSSSLSAASRTDPAVPAGDSSTEYSMFTPRPSPSPKWLRIAYGRKATVTITSSIPFPRRSSTMCSMHGLPTIGTIGFGWLEVSGRRRVPSPPAMTTPFTTPAPCIPIPLRSYSGGSEAVPPCRRGLLAGIASDASCFRDLSSRFGEVANQGNTCQRKACPEQPQRPVRSLWGDHDESERGIEQPRRRFPRAVDGKLVPPSSDELVPGDQGKITRRDRERDPGQAACMPEQDHGRVDHQAVGERVGDLSELRLDVPTPREPAVDLVGDASHPEDDRRRPAVTAVRCEQQDDEDRNQNQAADRKEIRNRCQRGGHYASGHAERIRRWPSRSRFRGSLTPTATRFSGRCAAGARGTTSGPGASQCSRSLRV